MEAAPGPPSGPQKGVRLDITRLSPGPQPPQRLNVVVEIPRGGQAKYEYDATTGLFRLDRVLYASVHYPGAYGFVPGTRAGDGDPVDILVMGAIDSFTGALWEARPIGLLEMRDEKGQDEKVLAVPIADPRYAQVTELEHVPPHFLREVEHFFRVYKDLEGVAVQTFGWVDRRQAEDYVMQSIVETRPT